MLLLAISVQAQGRRARGPARQADRPAPADAAQCLALVQSTPKQALNSMEAAGLLYMREEEKLAHDVTLKLQAKWGSRTFGNITQAENRHIEMIKLLLDRYQLQDIAARNPAGTFRNEGIADLYHSFVAEGEQSLKAAWKVAAAIEELDIRDLEKAAQSTDNSDLKFVYDHLRTASENHMRVFVQQLSRAGDSYIPQHMNQGEFSQIIARAQSVGRGSKRSCPWNQP